jgi:quercetin dioxygenase-like cupin family protein
MSGKSPRLMLAVTAGAVVCGVSAILNWPGIVVATPAFQFKSEILARSSFEEIAVNTRREHGREDEDSKVKIKVEEPSDVYVVRNTVPPGGYSGWHTHPGPSVVLVKSGTATVYNGDDPSCTPVTYAAGTGFIDEGGGHVHMVRNEGTTDLVTVAFQIIPAGADRRIDAPSPGHCPF